ncbi:MAG: ASCH domain-containing protein [Alphaproteobacteria bacterium]|nr:ASCH domain-containing protein [Alphaproteobacteria bacterium]
MVAYNFKRGFVGAIQAKRKRQTVRRLRPRHARPGEALQLYTGMRTKHCRKILTPDPPCTRLDEIVLEVGRSHEWRFALFEINGIPLDEAAVEAFAERDGFEVPDTYEFTATSVMIRFWAITHGLGPFEGVVIHWDPSDCSAPAIEERRS